MVCQGTHILEKYWWKILKLCQINGLMLGLTPVVFSHLANFVNPRNSSAALCGAFLLHLDPTSKLQEFQPNRAPLIWLQNVSVKSKVSRQFSSRWNWGIFQHPSKVPAAKFRMLHSRACLCINAIPLKGYIWRALFTLFELLTCNFDFAFICNKLKSRINR